METFKGIIALDIDGTITVDPHHIDERVKSYLNQLIGEGWLLIFLTGRTFTFAHAILSHITGNYYFAPQNGAALYEMPSGSALFKKFLPTTLLFDLDPLFHQHSLGLLVEAGKENGDKTYYKPAEFTPDELEYLALRAELSLAGWEPVTSYHSLAFSEFPVLKFFAPEALAHQMAKLVLKRAQLNVIVIRDPFRPGYHLAHLNAAGASKGSALEALIALKGRGIPVIAAGDDYNDVEMLEKSTVKIVMGNAPTSMHSLADIVAPPARELGIIEGLEKAIWKVSSK